MNSMRNDEVLAKEIIRQTIRQMGKLCCFCLKLKAATGLVRAVRVI